MFFDLPSIEITDTGAGPGAVTFEDSGTSDTVLNIGSVSAVGAVTITKPSTGNLLITEIDATGSTVTLTASMGAINDNEDDTVDDILGTTLTLTALDEIGGGAATKVLDTAGILEVASTSLDVSTTGMGTTHQILLTEANGTSLTNLDTVEDDITVVSTTGNLTVADVHAGTTSAGAVTLTASAGAIIGTAAGARDITGNAATLSATKGIGTTTLETAVGGLITFSNTGAVASVVSIDDSGGASTTYTGSNTGLGTTITIVDQDAATGFATGGTITGGSGTVQISADKMNIGHTVTGANINLFTNTATRPISVGLEVGTSLSLEQGELQNLSSPGTVTIGKDGTQKGGISVGGAVNLGAETFDLSLFTDGSGIDATGALKTITLNTVGSKTLTLNAEGGIGATNAISFNTTNVSATNAVSGSELKLAPTGNITLGVAATTINQLSGGSIDVLAGGTITIGGDVMVAGAGTITLDAAGATATINRTAGTVTAATVELGTNGATTKAIGDTGTVLTAATTQLNADATGAVLKIDNTGALLDLQLNADLGTITFTNTGTTNTGANITANVINLSSTEVFTIDKSIVADVGALNVTMSSEKNLDVTAAGSLATNAGSGDVTLTTDDASLAGTVNAGANNINIFTTDADTVISLGTAEAGTANQLDLTEAELKVLASTGTVTIGKNGTTTGNIVLGGVVNLGTETFDLTLATEGNIVTTGAGKTLTIMAGETLTLDALSGTGTIGDATNALSTAATVIDADAGGATLRIANTGNVTDLQLNATNGTITYTNVGTVNTGAPITANVISLSADNTLTIDEKVVSSGGAITLATTAADKNLDFTAGSIQAATTLELRSDEMNLAGSLASALVGINVFTFAADQGIAIGAAAAGELSLVESELKVLASSGLVTIGEDGVHTAGIDIDGAVDLSAENYDLTLVTDGGGIDDTGGGNTIDVTGETLTLDAQGGIGNTKAISFTSTNISATNAMSGTELKLAPTGNITLGVAATVIDQQVMNGSIDVDAGGNITVGGNVTVSGGGAATTITLLANGTINGTLTKSVTAKTVILGDAGTTQIGNSVVLETAATTQLDAEASGAVLTINNTGALLDLQLNADSGTITFANTGTTNTGAAITANVIDLKSSGVFTIDEDVTADTGDVTVEVRTADTNLDFTAGTIQSTIAAVTLRSDNMNLAGTAVNGKIGVTLEQLNNAQNIKLGGAGSADSITVLGLNQVELAKVVSPAGLTIGKLTGTNVTIDGAVDLVTPGTLTGGTLLIQGNGNFNGNAHITSPIDTTLTFPSGAITFAGLTGGVTATGNTVTLTATAGAINNVAPTAFTNITAATLNATSGGDLAPVGGFNFALRTAVSTLTAGSGGVLNIINAGAVTATLTATGALDFDNAGTILTGGAISGSTVNITGDNTVTIAHNVTGTGGLVNLTTTGAGTQLQLDPMMLATNITLTSNGGADITLSAQDMFIDTDAGDGDGIVLFSPGGVIVVDPRNAATVHLGDHAPGGIFNLTDAEMDALIASNSLAIGLEVLGVPTTTSAIVLDRDNANSFGANSLKLNTTTTVDDNNNGDAIVITGAGVLTLNATGGAGTADTLVTNVSNLVLTTGASDIQNSTALTLMDSTVTGQLDLETVGAAACCWTTS